MNTEQEKKLRAFAQTANWSMLHVLDEARWGEFMDEIKNDPDSIHSGEVYGILVGCGCPDATAGVYEYKSRKGRGLLSLLWHKIATSIRRVWGKATRVLSIFTILVSSQLVFPVFAENLVCVSNDVFDGEIPREVNFQADMRWIATWFTSGFGECQSIGSVYLSNYFTVLTDSGVTWCAVASPSWISVQIDSAGIRILVEENKSRTERTGSVVVYFKKNEATVGSQTIPVKQKGALAALTQDIYPWTFGKGNAVTYVNWKATADSDWISIEKWNGGASEILEFNLSGNILSKNRTGRISLNSQYIYPIQQGQLDYVGDARSVESTVSIGYGIDEVLADLLSIDDAKVLSSNVSGFFVWQPRALGQHKLVYTLGARAWTNTLNITALTFEIQKSPNPPMSLDSNITITPTTRDIEVGGNGGAILVSGSSATWTAAVSDDWIKLNATSGNVGYPVAYTVGANTNVEERVGYVYVSGHVHTIKQAGVGGSISPSNQEFECDGGYGTVNITAPNKIAWHARPNVDWLSVTPTSGTGEGEVTFQVAPWHEVSTRSGTLTIAGQTFTVFQYGKRMKLEPTSGTCNYEPHVFPITVNALAITKWSVTPNNSWLSVVDGGNGQGSDLVTVAAGENPSYKARTGTVTIGTETFTITQEGRTALEFSISPTETTASVNGANGLISVYATPDLPWTAASGANWLTVMDKFKTGSGNGNVVYTASPNSTLFDRTGTITVTPEAASGVKAKTQTVTQPAALATLSISGYEFAAAGESCAVDVTVANIVEWGVSNLPDWLTASGTSFVGPGTVTLQASQNETVYPRSATIRIAEHDFKVTQKARGVEVEYDTKLFKTDGGYESISVHPDGNVSWTAVASDSTWIVIYGAESGTGDGEVMYIVAPYVGDGTARTGTITIGDKVVYITQRAYDLTIDPYAKWVTGNAGAGEIGVSASIGDVWTAIVTEPTWISLVSGYDAGTGSGTVRFVYTENDTGKTRTGKIVIAGEVYTLTQAARTMVAVSATTEGGGTVSGAGSYVLGTDAVLTAVPDDGWEFLYWSGAVSSMQNPITITADVAKSVTATFGALTPEFTSATSDESGVTLEWKNLAWATQYKIYRAPTSENVGAVIATITADGTHAYVDALGEVGKTYWYWVEAIGADVTTESEQPMTGAKKKPIVISKITYTGLKGAAHTNPATYQEETSFAFAVPTTGVTGYTFDKWSPAGITADMTGDQVVVANWTANTYVISYNANLPPDAIAPRPDIRSVTYDKSVVITSTISSCHKGYSLKGWATSPDGVLVYEQGTVVSNLTAVANAFVALYAIWEANDYFLVFHANGGSGTMANLAMTYDAEAAITSNAFVRTGYEFRGWATEAEGEVVYENGVTVSNLTAQAGGSVELYAVWELVEVVAPVITPANGSTFKAESCTVTITSATEGAAIYYSVNGRTPTATEKYLYKGPFTIAETSDITAFAYKDGVYSDYVDVSITKVVAAPLTLKGVLDETKLGEVSSDGDTAWMPVDDLTAVGESCAVSGVVEDNDEVGETSSINATVMGVGTLTFSWRSDCEPDPRAGKYSYDHAEFWVDDETDPRIRIDGRTEWVSFSTEITTEGKHTLVWKYVSDGYLSESGEYEDCVWLDNLAWSGSSFVDDPIPDIGDNPTQKQVEESLDGSIDAKLKEHITDGTSYNAYRNWAETIGSQAVKDSPNAWVSFALGSDKLLESAPKDEDLKVEAFEPTSEAGKFDFTVSVDGVDVGKGVSDNQLEVLKENLKQVFGLEGAASLDSGSFSSGNVDLSFGTPEDGKVKFTAGPKDATTETFFMRVKINP